MPNDQTDIERKLEKLADRLDDGWAKLHPVTEKELARVREAVRKQWENERQMEQRVAESKEAPKPAADKSTSQPVAEKKNQDGPGGKRQSNGHGQRHGH